LGDFDTRDKRDDTLSHLEDDERLEGFKGDNLSIDKNLIAYLLYQPVNQKTY